MQELLSLTGNSRAEEEIIQKLANASLLTTDRDLTHKDAFVEVAQISPDKRWIVTGSEDNTARLWDLSAKNPAANPVVLRGHDREVSAVELP